METKQMAKIDGNIHVTPKDGERHEESESCWCNPTWDPENKKQYEEWEAHTKVFVHKERKEMEQ